jgi:nitrogen-specific signal transduction histidine kinase
MTPDVQRQAFDPFFTTRRNEGGTGLGLHIVYNLVTQQLGGRMMLDSRLGQGTTFRIIIPKTAKGGQGIADTTADQTADATSDGISQWPNRTMSST